MATIWNCHCGCSPAHPEVLRAYEDFLAEASAIPSLWITTPSRLAQFLADGQDAAP